VQAVFLRTFPAIYGELLKIFTVREVAGFIRETLASLPTAVHPDSPLEAVKLQCIAKTVESQLYINPGKDLDWYVYKNTEPVTSCTKCRRLSFFCPAVCKNMLFDCVLPMCRHLMAHLS